MRVTKSTEDSATTDESSYTKHDEKFELFMFNKVANLSPSSNAEISQTDVMHWLKKTTCVFNMIIKWCQNI